MAVETMDYTAALRRMIRAYGRRVGAGDLADLQDMLAVRDYLDTQIGEAVQQGRDQSAWSWADIGRAANTSRQAAQQRWG